MKQDKRTTRTETRTTASDVCRWVQELFHLHARIAPRLARPEPRRRALAYLQGILSETSRKNGWQLAEHAGEARPDGMQRLLSQAVWNTDGVRDDLRSYALEQLGQESAILAIDETSFPKQGKKSAGVGLQYCGTTGRVENCQVGVFLSYVTAKGHTLLDRELYLPLDWCEDRDRCRAVGIPEAVRFQTKPELAVQMIERIWQAQIPLCWVVADTVYGGNLDLRSWLEAHGYPYVLAVACDEPVGFQTGAGRRREEAALVEAFVLSDRAWQRLSMSEGTKGPRLFDWAIIPMLHQWEDDGRHWLLIRRSLTDPNEKAYSFVFAPQGTTLPEMVKAIGARWHVEEDFENGKDIGLDHYEVRSFIGWYRHITLVLLALAYLAGICVLSCGSTSPPVTSGSPPRPPALPLTIPEVRHLLARLIWLPSGSVKRALAWSWWRRCHRSAASYYHTKRRLKAGSSWLALTPSALLCAPPCSFPRLPRYFLEVSEFWECSGKSARACVAWYLSLKGVLIMTTLPVADGAQMLGIHPKTLHHWLKQAHVPLAAHPTDARLKWVTLEQIQQVASLHGRPLQSPATARPVLAAQGQAPPMPENEAEHLQTAHCLPTSLPQEADLIQKLSCLEAKVATLQEHLAHLALALLEARERSVERRISALETVAAELVAKAVFSASLPDAQVTGLGAEPAWASSSPRPLNPAEQRARSRMPALIEYGAQGTYVIISSLEGELHLEPDSPEWFDWLASLSSFRFVGQQGRFTAYRDSKHGRPTRSWRAYRCIHQQNYKHSVGVTDQLTITRLEQVAAILQAHVDAL